MKNPISPVPNKPPYGTSRRFRYCGREIQSHKRTIFPFFAFFFSKLGGRLPARFCGVSIALFARRDYYGNYLNRSIRM